MTARSRVQASARAFAVNLRSGALCRAQLSFGVMWAAEWAAPVAVSVVAYHHGGAAAVALVAVARMLPAAVVAPFAATLADRYRRDQVLAGVGVGRAGTLGAAAALLAGGAPNGWGSAAVAPGTPAPTLVF